jgi:hypothetical protein
VFNELLAEYRVSLGSEMGPDPNVSRRRMIAFADRMPSLRIAVDLKVELFRNATKTWTMNAIHDIDALSLAVPYCHVVVPDKEMAHLLARSRAGERTGTRITGRLDELPDMLPDLVSQARSAAGDLTGRDWAAPGEGFCLDMEELLNGLPSLWGARSLPGL